MWLFKRKKNKLFTISLTPQNITCSIIEKPHKKNNQYCLKAYKRSPLKKLEFTQAILFNPTSLKKIIKHFMESNELKNVDAAISISGPRIFEKIITVKSCTPDQNDFCIPELNCFNWDCSYLCPSQNKGFDFFVCGIRPEHLFSYQLLANSCNINLTTIITEQLAYLHVYRTIRGNKFIQNQLSLDLLKCKYETSSLLSEETIKNTIKINPDIPIDIQKEYLFLGNSLGLFISERNL